jgi:mannose-6-phosphate isomerase-like protein (cupin superfamily)
MKIIKSSKLDFIPASHEDPQNPNVLKKILLEKDDLVKGRVQMINWAKLLPGRTFVSHYHQDMQEIFILLSGTATMIIDDEEAIMQPGDVAIVPIKATHSMRNETNIDIEYIVMGVATGQDGKTINI